MDTTQNTEITLLRPAGLVSSPAFSHVAVLPPNTTSIQIGGQSPVDAEGAVVGGTDVAHQVQQVMDNLATALAAADAGMADLVSMTIVVVDGVDLREAYPVAAAALDPTRAPLVTVMRVAGLAVPGALVEVSATAAVVR